MFAQSNFKGVVMFSVVLQDLCQAAYSQSYLSLCPPKSVGYKNCFLVKSNSHHYMIKIKGCSYPKRAKKSKLHLSLYQIR